MELNELNKDEKLACVALMRLMVLADENTSEQEVEQVDHLSNQLGEDIYQQLVDEVEERFSNIQDLKDFLAGINRQDARDLIYETILQCCLSDGLGSGFDKAFSYAGTSEQPELKLLEWIESTWKIKVDSEE